MNAVLVLKKIMGDPQRSKIIDLDEIMDTGNISFKIKDLTDQEKRDLSHLRIDFVNGGIFDDRDPNVANYQEGQ